MPADKYCEDEGMNLPEALLLLTVTGDYPDDVRAINPADGDIICRGDPQLNQAGALDRKSVV